MKQLIGKIVCHFRGHLRGRRIESQENGKVKIFECPRCFRRTEYKKSAA
jgi:hypothetical protein